MQIFVKEPVYGRTRVFDCSTTTTLRELIQWIEDMTGVPDHFYYITYNSKYISKNQPEDLNRTLAELNIQPEHTVQVNGRIHVSASAKKLNGAA